jgi:hypothetical protein
MIMPLSGNWFKGHAYDLDWIEIVIDAAPSFKEIQNAGTSFCQKGNHAIHYRDYNFFLNVSRRAAKSID